MPELAPCPAMPVFATDPLRFRMKVEKSIPFTTGATPMRVVGAPL